MPSMIRSMLSPAARPAWTRAAARSAIQNPARMVSVLTMIPLACSMIVPFYCFLSARFSLSLARNRSYSVFLLVILPSAGSVSAWASRRPLPRPRGWEGRDGGHAARRDVDAEWPAVCHERGHESADVAVDVDPFAVAGLVRSDAADGGGPCHRFPSGSSWLGSNARLVASMSMPDPSSPAVPLTMRRDPCARGRGCLRTSSLAPGVDGDFPRGCSHGHGFKQPVFRASVLPWAADECALEPDDGFRLVVLFLLSCVSSAPSYGMNAGWRGKRATPWLERTTVLARDASSWNRPVRAPCDPVPAGHGPGFGPAGAPSTGQAGGASTWTVHCRMTRG